MILQDLVPQNLESRNIVGKIIKEQKQKPWQRMRLEIYAVCNWLQINLKAYPRKENFNVYSESH